MSRDVQQARAKEKKEKERKIQGQDTSIKMEKGLLLEN